LYKVKVDQFCTEAWVYFLSI